MKGKGKGKEDWPELRFKVDDRVQCRVGPGDDEEAWAPGTVVKQWYSERHWPPHRIAPYQIRLDDGRLIFAPMDDDRVIRLLSGIVAKGKVPVTILTGFLGSGKTTLLNYILKTQHGKKYAVIENEIGAVGIDNMLLENEGYNTKAEESITLLDNGCLCCTVRDDLVKAIKGIVEVAKAKAAELPDDDDSKVLDGILIETTGIADPGPICKTFYGDVFCSTYCKIDGVITLVDAVNFMDQLKRERTEGAVNESERQVAFADKILLNKVDAASPEKLQNALTTIKTINGFVAITKCSLGKTPEAVPIGELLSCDAFDTSKLLDDSADIDLSVCGVTSGLEIEEPAKAHTHGGEECKDASCEEHGHGGHGGHGGGHGHAHGDGHECGDECTHESHGDGKGHGHGHGHGHGAAFRHDTEFGSFVCTLEGKPIDRMKFNHFMSNALENDSENLYRYKGILAIEDPHDRKVYTNVIQGVHDQADIRPGDLWPKDKPFKSQLVMIGRTLDKAKYTSSFAELFVEDGV